MKVTRSSSILLRQSKIKIQNRKLLGLLLSLFALMSGVVAQAQQPAKVPRIGYLTGPPLSATVRVRDAFRQGLRELGYIEGNNIVIEWRSWEGKPDRQHALAAELVRLKVDVIVAVGSGDIRAAKKATTTIPIVMVNGGDAVGSGLVASLARPGGNVTGYGDSSPGAKRKAAGASQGNRSRALACGVLREYRQRRPLPNFERGRPRRQTRSG